MVRLQTQEPADGGADRAAVADHHEGAVVWQLLGVPEHHRGGAVGDLGLQLATAAADRLTALPGGVLLAVAGDDVLVREALPDARVGLPEALVLGDVQAGEHGQLGGRVRGALEVGGDDRVGLEGGQQPGGPPGLGDTGLGEGDIGGALEAALHVPRGLAVPPQDDAATAARTARGHLAGGAHRHSPSGSAASSAAWSWACSAALPRVALASSGSSSSGQSFHSRSRA